MSKEHNFISAVVYLRNNAKNVIPFLTMLYGQLESNFEKYEIVCVNDASTDDTAALVRAFAKERDFPLTLVAMSSWHGVEPAMNAGIDISIGDFVFEFDSVDICYQPTLLMDCYRKALTGCDIVWACPTQNRGRGRKLFYRVFNAAFDSIYRLREDAFRLVSRRALNRVHAISGMPPYRKAAYAASGLKLANIDFTPTTALPRDNDKDPAGKALSSLALYTDMFYKLSLGISLFLLLVTVAIGVYTVVIFLSPVGQVAGWTSTMLVMCIGFFGIFLMMTIVIKYLSLLVELVFKKQRYLVEGIEKIQK